jgi:hypothetical protein
VADLTAYLADPTGKVHASYQQSALAPAAPEYAVGDVLLSSAYRTLVLDVRDTYVQSKYLDGVVDRIVATSTGESPRPELAGEAWSQILAGPGGLASPRLKQGKGDQRLIPLVPELARYTGVMGAAAERRWQPGNLLVSALWSGVGPAEAPTLMADFRNALAVGPADDYLARYAEATLRTARHPDETSLTPPAPETEPEAPLWRMPRERPLGPAERFTADLWRVIELKPAMTRRQWTLLVEAHLRLGLSMYVLWLCHVNAAVWSLVRQALTGATVGETEIVHALWRAPHARTLLQVATDPDPAINSLLYTYAEARLGINLVLHALGAPDAPKVGKDLGGSPAPAALAAMLGQITAHRLEIEDAVRNAAGGNGVDATVAVLVDAQRDLVLAKRGTTTNNMGEFVLYVTTQLSTHEPDERAFDQGYLAAYVSPRKRHVRLSPIMLLLLVHLTQVSIGDVPATIADLQQHAGEYGLEITGSELRSGATAAAMDQQGLAVDSPDAGGGRLLVDAIGGR